MREDRQRRRLGVEAGEPRGARRVAAQPQAIAEQRPPQHTAVTRTATSANTEP